MSILINKDTTVLVQGITGREGGFHTIRMLEYGTKVVAGVTPGKGGEEFHGIPVYNTVSEAVNNHRIDAAINFVPARFAPDSLLEAAGCGIKLVVGITEGIPVHDMIRIKKIMDDVGTIFIGPNGPGIITAGECKIGIMPGQIFSPGPVGVISRSGTLTYQVVDELTGAGLGQTTCVGIGGDPIPGTRFTELLRLFRDDPDTKVVVLIGEIGGRDEEDAAEFVSREGIPVVAFIAGRSAPPGKRMGHAGAIISGTSGTAQAKIEAFNRANIPVAEFTSDIIKLVRERLK
ncbi:MAG: succinate--CoA ligase subunit alpha [Candidatus Eremiobacteraeota bacterium]|nr:succinate--CoA ligase subunit alpha [Candidatus Eremiobacteraeota bacterium]